MNYCNFEEIHGFSTPGEYKLFLIWLHYQINSKLIEQITGFEKSTDLPFGLEERRFRCISSGEIWRLVAPEAPFYGFWEPIKQL